MTNPAPPSSAPTRKPSALSRVALGVGSVLLLFFGIRQMRQGASEMKGPPKLDFEAAAKQSLAGTKLFKSPDGDFQLQYPASWEVSPKPNFKFHAQTLNGVVNVNVTSEALPPNMTLDGYVDGTLAGIKKAGIDPKPPIERANVTVNGAPAARLGIVAALPASMKLNEDARFDMLLAVANGKGYVVTCTTEARAAATMKPVFDGLINSMQLTK